MSFRSVWRHAAKTGTTPSSSPSQHFIQANRLDPTASEPTLVVNNSRPSSIKDMKLVRDTFAANGNATKANGDDVVRRSEEADKASVKDVVVKENGKEGEVGRKEEGVPQDAGWFGWWGGNKGETSNAPPTTATATTTMKAELNDVRPSTAPEPSKPVETKAATPAAPAAKPPTEPIPTPSKPQPIKTPPPQTTDTSSGNYLTWIWGSPRSPPRPGETEPPKPTTEPLLIAEDANKPAPTIVPSETTKAPGTPVINPQNSQNPIISTLPQTKASWMSFWARSDSMPDLKRQALPETMSVPDEVDGQGHPVKKQKTQDDSVIEPPPPQITTTPLKAPKPTHTPAASISSIPNTPMKPSASPKPETPSKKDKPAKGQVKVPPPPNHVLPEFESIYPIPLAKPSLFSRMTRAILPISLTPAYSIFPGALHARPQRAHPPQIRKSVAIGIHGFFPLRILRSVLGEPTGTSVKFAALASEAIHRFSEREYGDPQAIEVVKVALEGEGTVAARVDLLWKNLRANKEWMEHIREADLILVACHSQGSPVGAGIMARLVEEGIVETERTRLGLVCIAGIHLGPAIDVGQRVVIKAYNAIESEAARELYDFQDSDSKVSRKYIEALRTILAADTRVTLIGSIDDHLVPMYSSTFSTAYHGAIYRAVFIDGRIHQNDFLARLVAFALRLRNEGWRDHGVMSELSSALMGNFYTGEGHSRIYDEPAVYDLALRNTLETSSMKNMPLHVEPFKARSTPNPYLLPWSLRGVFEESIRGPLNHELDVLKEEFAKWDPKGPKLKDLKWRMEGWSTPKPKI